MQCGGHQSKVKTLSLQLRALAKIHGDLLRHERSFKRASDQIVFCAFYSFLVKVQTKLAEHPRDYDCGLLLLPAISQW